MKILPKAIKQRLRWNLDERIRQLVKSAGNKPTLKAALNEEGSRLQLYLYDAIDDYWGVGPTRLAKAIEGNEDKPIDLYVNSPGGYVWDGRAMQAILARHEPEVVAHIDGIAASAATTVVLGADTRNIAKGARFMIHNAWSIAIGNAKDMRAEADLLDEVDKDIADDYVRVSSLELAEIQDYMEKETYFSAEESVEHGFCDACIEVTDADPEDRNMAPPKDEELERMFAMAEMINIESEHLETTETED